jgi:uncharacterized protein (DUF1810 family)
MFEELRVLKMKLQHWCAFPSKNGWKSAPVLEFYVIVRA